ncbi:MAG: hypothetical protein PVJ02_02520 [Gemmatimonadota bacterium]|jgi:hypothetical protein
MILKLLRRERALMAALVMWPGAAAIGFMSAEMVGRRGVGIDGPEPMPPLVVFAFGVVFSVLASVNFYAAGGMEKATRFQMALPIEGRDLWVSRMIATLAPFPGAVAVAVVVYALTRGVGLSDLAFGLNGFALTVFLPALYYSVGVKNARGGMPLPIFIPAVLGVLAGCVLLGPYTLWPALLMGSGSILLLAAAFSRVPKAFRLHPGGVSVGTRRYPVLEAIRRSLYQMPRVGPELRLHAALRPRRWLNRDQFMLLILLGAALNVLLIARSPLTAVLSPIIVQVAWFIRTANGASAIDHLPVPRDRVFRQATLPGLIAAAALVGVAVWWSDALSLRLLVAAKVVPVVVLVYVAVWGLSLGSVTAALDPPALDPARWRWRFLLRISTWGWMLLAAVLGTAFWRGDGRGSAVMRLSTSVPGQPWMIWVAAAAACGVAYALLRRRFRRAELVGLHRGLAG